VLIDRKMRLNSVNVIVCLCMLKILSYPAESPDQTDSKMTVSTAAGPAAKTAGKSDKVLCRIVNLSLYVLSVSLLLHIIDYRPFS